MRDRSLLLELDAIRRDRNRLRRRVRELTVSRDLWRQRAREYRFEARGNR